MGTVVVDSTNLDAIVAEATGASLAGVPVAKVMEAQKAAEPKEPAKEPEKAEAKAETPPDDDKEDEDGLTPAQKRELTTKMLTAIGRKHRALKEAEEFATEQYNEKRMAEERAAHLAQELQRLKDAQKPAPKPPEEPKRENFKTEEEYQDARIDWRAEVKFQEKIAADTKRAEEKRQAEVLASAKERIDKAAELVPDFREVVGEIDTPVPPVIGGYMQESEMFAELAYHFAKHPELLEKLGNMNPARALVEVGKIESTLRPFSKEKASNGADAESKETAPAAEKETPSKASPETAEKPSKRPVSAPITPLSSGTASVEKPEREMTAQEALAEWQRKRNINLKRRQRH